MTTSFTCRICGTTHATKLVVREMMYGTRDTFDYYQCESCQCLQIADIPEDIARYYPANYYSYDQKRKKKRFLRDFTRKHRNLYAIEKKGVLGALLCTLKEPASLFRVYGRLGLTRTSTFLDVGGGDGRHVAELQELGFTNAMAVDPFIAGDVMEDGRLVAKKGTLFDLNEPYDLIAFHHSFEHMHPPRDILEKAHNLLKPGGSVLLRIPTVTSEAFETYGANWSDLDAPRHFYLHSHDSIQLLAEQAGFKVIDLWCDSNAFQFWASEQYAQDIPLNDPRSHTQPPIPPMFTSDQMAQFEAKAQTLNAQMRGDAICVWLKPAR